MGDRYISDVECAYCYTNNKNVMFADGWAETMVCVKCGKENKLTFHVVINASKASVGVKK